MSHEWEHPGGSLFLSQTFMYFWLCWWGCFRHRDCILSLALYSVCKGYAVKKKGESAEGLGGQPSSWPWVEGWWNVNGRK